MNAMINVARYHLVQPVLFVTLPLAMLAACGTGIVNRRWGMLGLLAFVAVQVPAGIAVAFARTWSGVGGPHPSLSALDLTGVIAALTVVILAGGHATIRRATV